ncbi:MAG: transposase, partial [Dehalococcoidia bacterium]
MRLYDVDMPNHLSGHHRRSVHLPGFDYAQPGAYFVTICAQGHQCVFGEVVDGEMRLSRVGLLVQEEWLRIADIRTRVHLNAFQVMPNHLHGIVIITSMPPTVGAHLRSPLHRAPKSLSSVVTGFKSAATKRVNELRRTPGQPLWQRNYHEHIIRNEPDLNLIGDNIVNNPAHWEHDTFNPKNIS